MPPLQPTGVFSTPAEVHAHLSKRRAQGLALGLDMAAQRRRVCECVRAEGPVLDIGTGKGHMAADLARTAPLVASIDPVDEDLFFARTVLADAGANGNVVLVQGNGGRLPFADEAFAAAISHLALHHFTDPPCILHEMVRVTRPGGQILVSDFDAGGFDVIEAIHQSEGRHHPVEGWPVKQAARHLGELGCDVRIESGPLMVIAVARKS